jgi:Domain of unknown function (DUF929)
MSLDAHEHSEPPAVHSIPRRYVALALIVVAIILVATLIWIRNDKVAGTSSDAETFTPAPTSLVQSIGHLPAAVVNGVDVTSATTPVTAPSATGNPSLWQASDGHTVALPVVFFYGAEFAPYAAAERWPVIVALSRFGNFSQLGLLQSSPSVAFPDTPTFTFSNAKFSSVWVDLQTVERYGVQDPTGSGYTSLQTPTARQAASVSIYDATASTFPLLDIANHWVLTGSSFSPALLAGMSQSQIASDLAYPTSPVTQAVVGAANDITAAICTVTGQRPAAVCSTRGVETADTRMRIRPAG